MFSSHHLKSKIIIINLVSGVRLLMALVMVVLASVVVCRHDWSIGQHHSSDWTYNIKPLALNIVIFTLICVAGLSDVVDGHFARKWKATTWFGCAFDFMADRSFAVCTFLTLAAIGCVPKWTPAIWVVREISSIFFFGISTLPFRGRKKFARPIELSFFVLVFWINGQNRFIHVDELTRQLLWIPLYGLILFSVLKFAYYCRVQWPLSKAALDRPSETKFLFPQTVPIRPVSKTTITKSAKASSPTSTSS